MPLTIATALVDRLMHHAHVIVTSGDSVRLTQATSGEGVKPSTNPTAHPRGNPTSAYRDNKRPLTVAERNCQEEPWLTSEFRSTNSCSD